MKGVEIRVREECLAQERSEICRERWEKWNLNHALAIYRKCSSMDQDFHRALNLDIKESIKVLSRICQWQKSPRWIKQSIENLSSRQRVRKLGSMDWRSCRDSIEKKSWNLDGSRICWGSIKKRERRLDRKRICWEAIELEEKEVFSGEKTHKDDCNKQATQSKTQSTY